MTEKIIITIKNVFKRELAWVWIFGFVSSLILAALSAKNKLPLGKGDFVFLALIALLVALYRPRWIFFLFVGSITLENIILAGGFLPIQLRPYQFLGGILILALAILYGSKRLGFKLLKPIWVDWLIFSLIPPSFLALIGASSKTISLKNNFILISFTALYYLIRNFIRSREDLIKTAFFFTISFITTILFGFYQVLADKFSAKSFEVMFGRPNSTFAEPDWLGVFLCFALAVFLALIFYFLRAKQKTLIPKKYILLFLDILIFLDVTLIVLTLSRSAWAGSAAVMVFYLLIILAGSRKGLPRFVSVEADTAQKIHNLNFKSFLREGAILAFIIFISLAAVRVGGLSKFNIFDRARSAATSEQKITIACDSDINIPASIGDVSELAKYSCQHINLEEIDNYKSRGKIVTQIYRKDPNVKTRSKIYRESFEIIKQNPIFGIGYGTITQKLGQDQRGAGLNESNIFLQVWAGSGILGLMAFIFAIGYLFIYGFRRISPVCPLNKIIGRLIVKDDYERTTNAFAVLGIAALLIPNLFNAGLFMGIFWLGLAVIISAKDI